MTTEIFRSSELAVRSACDFGSDACVITFDSYSDDRSLDRPAFGQDFFASRQIDAIHFVSRENDWYQHPELPDVAATVAALVKDHRRVVAYGSSMGGYGAIRFGGMAGASVALAISPQFSIDPRTARFERRWKSDSERIDFSLERTLAAPFVGAAYIVYDPRDLDRRHVERFRRRTRVIDVALAGVGHPATGALAEAGLLTDLVLDFVADRLDVADVTHRMALARETTPQCYFVMSERAFSARARMAYAAKAAAMAPHHFGLVTHYASLLAGRGRFAEAQIAFARAAALMPDSPFLLYKLTEFHRRRGDLDSAIEAADLLVSLHSETFLPRLERLRRVRQRASARWRWPTLTIAGRHIVGDPALPVDVRVTTTPSPPPFVESWWRHETLLERRPGGPVDLMLVGDSLVEAWPDALWAPLKVFNFGVKADKTQHALWRLEQLPAGSVECRDVVILLGTNNLGAGDTAAGIAAGVAAVVAAAVRVAPRAKVHVIGTPPCGPDFGFRSDVRRKANRALARLEGFETLDVDAELTNGAAPRAYMDDGIHFSAAGYRRLTEVVRRRIECRDSSEP
jgi:tetratricopeptide (TPR) repeat protein